MNYSERTLKYLEEESMKDASIIARRLSDGRIQYGRSGDFGCYMKVGAKLLGSYQSPENVEYLFSLGQTDSIGMKGSENGGFDYFLTHRLTGEPFWLGTTEQEIFSKTANVGYGYFYDLDQEWYYIVPEPFKIKIPLFLIDKNTNKHYYEYEYKTELEGKIVNFIFNKYRILNLDFKKFMEDNQYNPEKVLEEIKEDGDFSLDKLYSNYRKIYDYFDDWILIKSNEDDTIATHIIMKKKESIHIETNLWQIKDDDMYKIFEEIKTENELRAEGIEIMAKLVAILFKQNRMEDVKKITDDKEYRNRLLKEFSLI